MLQGLPQCGAPGVPGPWGGGAALGGAQLHGERAAPARRECVSRTLGAAGHGQALPQGARQRADTLGPWRAAA